MFIANTAIHNLSSEVDLDLFADAAFTLDAFLDVVDSFPWAILGLLPIEEL
jgi:hypothetical protein